MPIISSTLLSATRVGFREIRPSFRKKIHEKLQSIFNDTMPVEYTPAVGARETHAETTLRIRRTFIAINSYAKTDKVKTSYPDETDGFAIVARRFAGNHPLFAGRGTNQRVSWKGTSIPSGRIPFITFLPAGGRCR